MHFLKSLGSTAGASQRYPALPTVPRALVGALVLLGSLQPASHFANTGNQFPTEQPTVGPRNAVQRSHGPWLISARLLDQQGSPISKATIELRPSPNEYDLALKFLLGQRAAPLATSTSQANGNFSAHAPANGLWSLEISKRGFETTTVATGFPVFRHTHYPPIRLKRTTGTTTVLVVDASGVPIANARVGFQAATVYQETYPSPERTNRGAPAPLTTSTSHGVADGSARWRGSATSYTLVAAAVGFLPRHVVVKPQGWPRAASQPVTQLMLEAAGRFDLRLELAPGVPASQAVVFVEGIPVAVADHGGAVSVPVALNHPLGFSVLHHSLASLQVSSAELSSLQSSALSALSVAHPLPTLPSLPQSLPSQPHPQLPAELGPEGETVPSTREEPVRLQLDPPMILGGVVVQTSLEGPPLEGAWVWTDYGHVTTTGKDGRYQAPASKVAFASPYAETVSSKDIQRVIRAAAPQYFSALRTANAIHDPSLLVAPLPLLRTATLRGRVVDARGRGVAGVDIRGPEPRIDFDPLFQGLLTVAEPSAVSEEDGSFTLWPITPLEEGYVYSHAKGYAKRVVKAPPIEPGGFGDILIQMQVGMLVTGHVVDASDHPISGVRVVLTEASVEGRELSQETFWREILTTAPPRIAYSDSEGRFGFVDMADGHYNLIASATTYAPTEVNKVAVNFSPNASPERDVHTQKTFDLGTVILSQGAEVGGRVETELGVPIQGAWVVVVPDQRRMLAVRQDHYPIAVSTQEDGRFRFDSLVPNLRHQIRVERDGYVERTLTTVPLPPSGPPPDEVIVTLQRGISLEVLVSDEKSRPLEGAGIYAIPHRSARSDQSYAKNPRRLVARQGQTAGDGRVTLENLGKGTWDVSVDADGYVSSKIESLTIDPTFPPAPLKVTLRRGATLTGTITSANGEPINKARISSRHTGGKDQPRGSDESGAQGQYVIDGLTTGNASFEVTAQGYRSVLRDVTITPGTTNLDVQLASGAKISGMVLGLDGKPQAGAVVYSTNPRSRSWFGGDNGVPTNSAGEFTLGGLEPGRYQVVATKDGLPRASLQDALLVQDADVHGILLTFAQGSNIHGTVTGLSDDELAQTDITAYPLDHQAAMGADQPDYEGNFAFANLGSGQWMITARSPHRWKSKHITLGQGGSDEVVDIEFGTGFNLTGTVLRDGQPAPQINVTAHNLGTSLRSGETTDQDGRFEILDLEPGSYRVSARVNAGSLVERRVELDGDLDIELSLEESSQRVRVVDQDTGVPLTDSVVRISSIDHQGFDTELSISDRADADGLHTLLHLPPGKHRVSARAPGYGPASSTVVIKAQEDPPLLELGLKRSVPFALTFSGPTGQPPRFVTITILRDAQHEDGNMNTSSRSPAHVLSTNTYQPTATGRVKLFDAKPGTFMFLFSARSNTTVRRRITVPEAGSDHQEPVLVQIPAGGSLRIEVPGLHEGARLGWATLTDDKNAVYVRASSPHHAKHRLRGGKATLYGIAPGTYTLSVTVGELGGSSEDHWQQTVTVLSNQTTSVTLN